MERHRPSLALWKVSRTIAAVCLRNHVVRLLGEINQRSLIRDDSKRTPALALPLPASAPPDLLPVSALERAPSLEPPSPARRPYSNQSHTTAARSNLILTVHPFPKPPTICYRYTRRLLHRHLPLTLKRPYTEPATAFLAFSAADSVVCWPHGSRVPHIVSVIPDRPYRLAPFTRLTTVFTLRRMLSAKEDFPGF